MAATGRTGLIVVSCGQVTDAEKTLGKQVCGERECFQNWTVCSASLKAMAS